MPVYLVHGFRWPRAGFTGIRVHVIENDLLNSSAEYIQNEMSQREILQSFRKAYPEIMQELESPGRGLTLLEQYDPDDVTSDSAVSQPWAFVGDKVVTLAGNVDGTTLSSASGAREANVAKRSASMGEGGRPLSGVESSARAGGPDLSVNMDEVVAEGPGLTAKAWEALADLRDKIAQGEKIGWWVVYNGDPERAYDGDEEEEYEEEEGIEESEEAEDVKSEATVLPQVDVKKMPPPPPPPESPEMPQVVPTISTDRSIPDRSVAREKGKRVPGMKAQPIVEKSPPPQQTAVMATTKPEGLKKFFFGRK